MAFKINATTEIDNNGLLLPGNFTVATLPAAAGVTNGSMAYCTDVNQLYYKKTSGWVPITAKLGSASRPAASAAAIISAGDSMGDGVYYIQSTTGVIQTYCDMTNGGYMLAAIIGSGDSNWYYDGAYWSYTSTVNEGNTTSLGTTSAINRLYYEYSTSTGFRMCLGSGSKTNGVTEAYTGVTAKTAFTTNRTTSSQSRSTILSWFTTGTGTASSVFDNQPNCNVCGFYLNYTYAKCRWGVSMNNEADCATNDSAAGFGCYGASGGSYSSAGGATWNPNQNIQTTGYIFVK